jgi:hypothetical protein
MDKEAWADHRIQIKAIRLAISYGAARAGTNKSGSFAYRLDAADVA